MLLPTVYRAQILGGLLFGVGFVLSGWCPGTGGRRRRPAASWTPLVFLVGAVLGSIGFNEMFGALKSIGDRARSLTTVAVLGEPASRWSPSGCPRPVFALAVHAGGRRGLSLRRMGRTADGGRRQVPGQPVPEGDEPGAGRVRRGPVHPARSSTLGRSVRRGPACRRVSSSRTCCGRIEAAEDHIEPEELADRLHGRARRT